MPAQIGLAVDAHPMAPLPVEDHPGRLAAWPVAPGRRIGWRWWCCRDLFRRGQPEVVRELHRRTLHRRRRGWLALQVPGARPAVGRRLLAPSIAAPWRRRFVPSADIDVDHTLPVRA